LQDQTGRDHEIGTFERFTQGADLRRGRRSVAAHGE
jgi:hypothetical protein